MPARHLLRLTRNRLLYRLQVATNPADCLGHGHGLHSTAYDDLLRQEDGVCAKVSIPRDGMAPKESTPSEYLSDDVLNTTVY
jgi:hypothetical protein